MPPGLSPAEGANIRVSAPSTFILSRDRAGNFHSDFVKGLSFGGPYVVGAVAELILLDRAHGNRAFSSAAATSPTKAKQLFALKVLEALEASAEDPEPPAGQPLPNAQVGFGRINLWKASLVVVNDGLPEADSRFPSLSSRPDAEVEWYGFEIMTRVKDATVWLRSPNAAAVQVAKDSQAVVARHGLKAGSRVPRDLTVADGEAVDGFFVTHFSVLRNEAKPLPEGKRVMELRRPGQNAADPPFMSVELDLVGMRDNLDNDGPGIQVLFNSFVFVVKQQ